MSLHELIRKPIVHFILIGIMLFGVHQIRGGSDESAPRVITISPAFVDAMSRDYTRRTGRTVDAKRRRALIDDRVGEEILYREALALGLHRGDQVIRARLVQKMRFLLMDTAPATVSEHDLKQYLADNPQEFASPTRVSYEHVFFASSSQDALPRAQKSLARLRDGAEAKTLGDPFIRSHVMKRQSKQQMAAIFGASFARQAIKLPAKEWSPPLQSSYGYHLVRINERVPATSGVLATVRGKVHRAVLAQRQTTRRLRAVQKLRGEYKVVAEGARQ